MSQDVVNFALPTGLNWNLQSPGAVVTVARVFCWAAARAGLAALVSALNNGKVQTMASARPAMMIGLRPILSESQPNTTKKIEPSASAIAIMMLTDCGSTLSTF